MTVTEGEKWRLYSVCYVKCILVYEHVLVS